MQAQANNRSESVQTFNVTPVRVMLVEDETLFARAVVKRLQKAGYECERAETIADGRALARQFQPDLVLLDMRLPDGNGMDLLDELVAKGSAVIVLTAHGDVSDAVQAMKQGATDYLKKPIDLEELLVVVEKTRRSSELKHQLDYSRERDNHAVEGVRLLGDGAPMQLARAQIERIAKIVSVDQAPTLLITGETGTGKDVAARYLHHVSPNASKPFVHVDCASLPAELIEGELFGNEKGAYTNAQAARCGLIEAAEDGTLFLDEIGELPLTLQAKLLNVLERRVVRRLGSTKERPVLARFVAATNRDLNKMVEDGRFRADLYYRLNVLTIYLPPLRNREGDALLLAHHFVAQTERRYGLISHRFTPDAVQAILQYAWPGNVRELKHHISRTVLLSQSVEISSASLALPHLPVVSDLQVGESNLTLEENEKKMIEHALQRTHGNVSEAARLLGITRMTIRYRMDKYGIR